jgi:acyl-homoserine lactone acylase PvdQ
MIGNLFQGGTSNAMGTNRHLGWAFTWNYFDRVDVYKLKMNPKNKLQYEFDGKWETLEKRPVKLHVKVKGLKVSVNKMSYWSKYGCTLKSDNSNSFYAIRFPANMNIKAAQQLYEMAKATNYTEFWGALRRNHGIALFNLVYADYKNNIFYLSHGAMPDRKNQKYNWAGILPGNTSENLWSDLVKMDSMPHVINPKCGFVYNSNNNVFDATCEGENDNPNRLPAYVNQRNGNNNRAVLLKDFFASKEKFTMKEFQDIKFTTRYPKNSNFIKSLQPLWDLDKTKYPDIADAIQLLKTWDLNTQASSYATTLFAAFIKMVWEKNHYDDYQFVTGAPNLTEEATVQYLRDGAKFMKDNFGSIRVRWGDVHKLRRGDKAIGMGSFVDLLSPSYPKPNLVNGKLELNPEHGDTYTMFVKYSPAGAENVETLMPLGNSLDPKSKHYNDQMENFVAHKMKKMPFEKTYWIEHAESNYHPK